MHGYLVIADISGYTQFLTDSELDHGNGVVADLLNSIIGAIEAPLTVSSIEGDAIFMYGEMTKGMYGQTVLESVELLYCAFASALENMVINTTCTCNACVNIGSLGLKIVLHCGEFMKASVGDITTLSGPDVIAVHRLLKNHVVEATGVTDYLLITQQCVDTLDVSHMVAAWTPHSEEYEHIGVVDGYVSSLHDVWTFLQKQKEIKIAPADAWDTVRGQSVAPPAVIWDHLIDPRKRVEWITVSVKMGLEATRDGRIGPGTEFHCAHGDGSTALFTVLDMRPFDYATVMVDFVEGSFVTYTYYLMPTGSGTRIFVHASAPATIEGVPIPELKSPDYLAGWHDVIQGNIDALTSLADTATAALQEV
ncbi:MAG: hypothetical protein BMS9Abin12_0277 [Acidimicrobiia bacterium]|nr:MAG: hypothetical protein BMS9Abin12_0277 [Acidimicrobiia bacterium]